MILTWRRCGKAWVAPRGNGWDNPVYRIVKAVLGGILGSSMSALNKNLCSSFLHWWLWLLLVDGIGALMADRINPVPVPVVARVLSSSDILVKIYDSKGTIKYSHRRWGRNRALQLQNGWIPTFVPTLDLRQFIFDFNAGTHHEFFTDQLQPAQFTFKKAK